MKKLVGYTVACVGHGAHSVGRTSITLLYDDGSYERGHAEPEGVPCLASYERSAGGIGGGVSLSEFLGGALSRGDWNYPEIVAAAQKFWVAREKRLVASRRQMEVAAEFFAQEVRRFLRAGVARPIDTIPTAGWFYNAQFLGGRLARIATILKESEWEYREVEKSTGLTVEEYEDFLVLVSDTPQKRRWWATRPWSRTAPEKCNS